MKPLVIDGSYGEGGGQVLRSSLTLSLLLGRPILLRNIRARRPKPGLQPQHLCCVVAAARIGAAQLEGGALGSPQLSFAPSTILPGHYTFDVAQALSSAGAATLVLQTVLLPLALGQRSSAGKDTGKRELPSPSEVRLKGGTHVPWSPPYHYLEQVFLPTVTPLGLRAAVSLEAWGWYPRGGGVITASIQGCGNLQGADLTQRGELVALRGVAAVSRLPRAIAERQRRRALALLQERGFAPDIAVVEAPSPGPGTGLFLWAEFERVRAGFSALGERGKPAEQVAEEACQGFLTYYETKAALEPHLADQILVPLALAGEKVVFSTSRVTQHLLTNAWLLEQFLPMVVTVQGQEGEPGMVRLEAKG